MLTDAQLSELLDRSKNGEGVMSILRSMGINPYEGTDWLQKSHINAVESAKKEQLKNV